MRLLILNILLLLAISACTTNDYDKKLVEQESNVLQGDIANQVSHNVKVLFTDSNVTKAILYAGRARIYDEKKETILDSGVHIDFIDRETGKKKSYLDADSAHIDDRTQNMIAVGNVVVRSDSKDATLNTEKLYWNNKTRKIHTDEYVDYNTPQEHFKGYGFEADENLENSTIYKVSGEQR